jgi:MFS family permease
MFFLHERSTQAAIQTVWLTLGACFAPVISGFLIEAQGWRWFHWLCTIMAGLALFLIFFFVPETQYNRNIHETLEVADVGAEDSTEKSPAPEHVDVGPVDTVPKLTYMQELKPWGAVNHDVSLLGAFTRPWATLLYPSMIWCFLSFGLTVGG